MCFGKYICKCIVCRTCQAVQSIVAPVVVSQQIGLWHPIVRFAGGATLFVDGFIVITLIAGLAINVGADMGVLLLLLHSLLL